MRRVSQLAYANGVDEDAETLMSFALEGAGAGDSDGEEWVATHTSKGTFRSTLHIQVFASNHPLSSVDPTAIPSIPTIGDIPDLDSISTLSDTLATTDLNTSKVETIEEMPDMDDIPDMDDEDEDGLGGGGLVEEEDEAALKPIVRT